MDEVEEERGDQVERGEPGEHVADLPGPPPQLRERGVVAKQHDADGGLDRDGAQVGEAAEDIA